MFGAGDGSNNNFESDDRLSKEIGSDLVMLGAGDVGNNLESDEGASLKEDGCNLLLESEVKSPCTSVVRATQS